MRDCLGGPRPCPLVSCRYHLMADECGGGHVAVHPAAYEAAGRKPLRQWTDEDAEAALLALPASCALDVADDGPQTAQRIGELLGCSKEAVLQSEERSLRRLVPQLRALERPPPLDTDPPPVESGTGQLRFRLIP